MSSVELQSARASSIAFRGGLGVPELPLAALGIEDESLPHILVDNDVADRIFRAGVLVINEKGEIRFQNRQATAMLDGEGVIGVRNGRLLIDRASVQRSFEAMVQRALAAHAKGERLSEILGVPDRSGVVRYALRAMAVSKREGRTEILLSVVDFIDNHGPSRDTFSAVFRLSDREAELAELFSKGFCLEEIAALMGVALNTARVHLRRIFLKTNCSGQIALMRLLSRLAIID